MTRGQARWAKAYFHWLAEQTHIEAHQTRTYWDALWCMHQKEFVWIVANDDNRIQDGLDLRSEFLAEAGAPASVRPDSFGFCTVLEVLVALSRRMAFVAGGEAEGWAAQFMINLDLRNYADPLSPRKRRQVFEMLDKLIWRNYDPDGTGGFFPLAWSDKDQRQVEIWSQLNAYAMEIHPEG